MFAAFLAFSRADDAQASMNQFVLGEWNVYEHGVSIEAEPNYTIEFHLDQATQRVVGSFWQNFDERDINKFHDYNDGELAQFVIAPTTPLTGNLIDFINTGRHLATYDFKMTPDGLMVINGKILNNYTYTVQLTNKTMSAFVSELGQIEVKEYTIARPNPIKKAGLFGKYSTILYIIGALFVGQAVLLCICNCRKNQLIDEYEYATGQKLQDVRLKQKIE